MNDLKEWLNQGLFAYITQTVFTKGQCGSYFKILEVLEGEKKLERVVELYNLKDNDDISVFIGDKGDFENSFDDGEALFSLKDRKTFKEIRRWYEIPTPTNSLRVKWSNHEWAKVCTGVNEGGVGGYAFEGDFLNDGEYDLAVGTIILDCYNAGTNRKHEKCVEVYTVEKNESPSGSETEYLKSHGQFHLRNEFLSLKDEIMKLLPQKSQEFSRNISDQDEIVALKAQIAKLEEKNLQLEAHIETLEAKCSNADEMMDNESINSMYQLWLLASSLLKEANKTLTTKTTADQKIQELLLIIKKLEQEKTDIKTKSGKPFASERSAKAARTRMRNKGVVTDKLRIIKVEGGFVLRNEDSNNDC